MRAQHWAALDLGTNTAMLLVAHGCNNAWVEDREWYRTTRLGEGLDRTHTLSEAAVDRTLAAAVDMVTDARSRYPLLAGTAVATSAVRDAKNGEAFLRRCLQTVGIEPMLLAGNEEACYVFRGVSSDRDPSEPVIHIDIGGGSSEVTAGTRGNCAFAESVDVGCVRLGERFGLDEAALPASCRAARGAVAAVFAPLVERLRQALRAAGPPGIVLATGGSATTFAAMELEIDTYERERIHGFRGNVSRLNAAVDALSAVSAAARARYPGVPVDRAGVLPSGLLILATFLSLLGAEAFVVSTRGLRAGLIDAMAAGVLAPSWGCRPRGPRAGGPSSHRSET